MSSKFEELKVTGRLPSPFGVGMSILKLTQDDDYSTEDLARTIQSDPALTGRLLKMANAARAAGVEAVTTVHEATMRLGARTVRNVALSFSLVSGHRTGNCVHFDYDRFWSESLAAAVACQDLVRRLRLLAPPEGFVLGLLSRIGRLALASVHPDSYGEILLRHTGRPDQELVEAERRAFEIDHREVAQALLLDWELPRLFGEAVAAFENLEVEGTDLEGLVGALHGAAVLAAATLAGGHGGPDTALERVRAFLGLEREGFRELRDAIVTEWRQWGATLEVPTSDLGSPGSPGGTGVRRSSGAAPALSDEEPVQGRRLRILAVDDDPVSLRLLVNELEKAGHEVTTARDGSEGLGLAMELNPQVVVTDWQMPEMDGIEFCQALRRFESGREMYVILLTGKEDEDHVVRAFDAGADDYVVKPFKPRVLMARVQAGERVARLQAKVARDQRKMQEQVAELGVLARRLEQASLTDELTGLPNRRFAMEHMDREWNDAARTGRPLSLIMADIDHFKRVNDEHGHDVGDVVLRETARVLRAALRVGETVCRVGGEELLVICRDTGIEGARACAERLRRCVEDHRIRTGGFDGSVTVSLGVAGCCVTMDTPDALLKAADEALYRAKESGRNRVVAWERNTARV